MMKCFRKQIEKAMRSLNAQNEILQIMALKVLCGIASDIVESGHYSIMLMRAVMRATWDKRAE